MIRSSYVPDRGDLVWLDFSPHAGHEQGGRRPAIVISPKLYNLKSGLGLFCPITSKAKGYPYECTIPSGMRIEGVVLADGVRNFDWDQRRIVFIQTAPEDFVGEVLSRLEPLVTAS